MIWRVLVVGLGRIGMGYDLQHDPAQWILTHARAFQVHPQFELVGGVDVNPERICQFEQHYACPGYECLDIAVKESRPDVVVIATPTPDHAATIHQVLAIASPQAILCEKPLAYSFDNANSIASICEQHGIELYVNYMRRSEHSVVEIYTRLRDGRIVAPLKGVSWYSKGLLNNGSHFLNLLQYWLGPVRSTQVIDSGRLWANIDPEPDVYVQFELGAIVFLAAQEENYSHYTIELIASNGRLRYEQGGGEVLWQSVIVDPACEGYRILNPASEAIASDLHRCQWHVVDQLAISLSGQTAKLCSGRDALATQTVLHQICHSLNFPG